MRKKKEKNNVTTARRTRGGRRRPPTRERGKNPKTGISSFCLWKADDPELGEKKEKRGAVGDLY